MKARGFTLIELMVVIIIIGILASVATMKIGALSGKAKLSTISTVAGTYENLQQAYTAQNSDFGNFTFIGFSMPSSTNFTYIDNFTSGLAPTGIDIKINASQGDCLANSTWNSTISSPFANPIRTPPNSIGCKSLVSNF